jgi:peptidyl-prolyl cis-trans isomerase D
MLEAEIRKDMLAEKVYAQTQAYDDAHQGGASLAESAKKAGVTPISLGPITAQGQTEPGQPAPAVPPKVLETAFGLPAGGESEITELGDGAYFAVKVERIVAAHVPPLDEIRPQATQAWIQRELVRALEAKATALSERIRKGEAFDAVAASAGLSVTRVPGLTRQAAASRQDLGREVLARALGSRPGEVWTAGAPGGIVVGQVGNIRMDAGPTAARIAQMSRGELSQVLFREMGESAQLYARNKLKTKVNAARARDAVGFEPLPEKGKAGEAEKKK